MGPRALTAAALIAAALGCSGPRATAGDTRVRPSSRSGFYRVETRVSNAGGSGEIELTIRLRNKETGRIVTHQEPLDLQPRDRADVAVEIPAPPGDYAAEVSVEYPPR
ncbi:MAG TPA: hypothetical protein VHO06_02140 [Polyangia bacterium]|nr:hypothetical protein [Polyangia bacterium]